MNPRVLLLVIAALAMFNSCTKETTYPTHEEPLPGSVIDIFYEEEASALQETSNNNRFVHIASPPSVRLDCRSNTPSVIVPKMYNNTLELIYAKNNNFTGANAEKIKALGWKVNGKEQLDLTTSLTLACKVGDVFQIELTVTFADESTHTANFSFEASPDLQTLADGTITYDSGANSFSGPTIGQSCVNHLNRAISIVIVDIAI